MYARDEELITYKEFKMPWNGSISYVAIRITVVAAASIATSFAATVIITIIFRCFLKTNASLFSPILVAGFYDCTQSMPYYAIIIIIIIICIILVRFYFFIGSHNSVINILVVWYCWIEMKIIIFIWNSLKCAFLIPLKALKSNLRFYYAITVTQKNITEDLRVCGKQQEWKKHFWTNKRKLKSVWFFSSSSVPEKNVIRFILSVCFIFIFPTCVLSLEWVALDRVKRIE